MKIVVGLGNPGRKYVGTRHNVGFDVLVVLAERFSAEKWRPGFEAEVTEIQIGSERLLLVAPQTFMNLSGRSVRAVVNFYKVPLQQILLIHDDINLPTGRLRLRASGSAGGQKGLQNTIDQLGSREFPRLKIGVGRPPAGQDVSSYVLQKFSKTEWPLMEECVHRAASAVETWCSAGIEQAMNEYNRVDECDSKSGEST